MTEEKFYPPQADTYPNALHIIPAPDAHQAIESVTSDSRNNEAVIGQLKNCEVLAIHKNNGFEGSGKLENSFQNLQLFITFHIQILMLILIN